MEFINTLFAGLPKFVPLLTIVAIIFLVLGIAHRMLLRRKNGPGDESGLYRWLAFLIAGGLGVLVVIFVLPVETETRNQLLGLLGLLLSAMIALSSTTFLANILAGVMLRAMGSFKPGDFVQVGDQFGRVTERRLFYAEIQTENRDLATIPNLYLVSQPITVIRANGTIVAATVSLGYENPHQKIEVLLIEAARSAHLEDPFVQVMELGDYSVTYRIAGFLSEVKQILTARSNLRKMMMDTLHGAEVEIVSPAFMNQRPQPAQSVTLPADSGSRGQPAAADDQIPEELIFDKAEELEKLSELRLELETQAQTIKELESQVKSTSGVDRARLEGEISWRRNRSTAISAILENGTREA
ncbi:MAG: mechanosensitive ion channel family protein [Desulfobacterales bacterium]